MTIRKFSPQAISFKQLLLNGALDDKMLYFLNQTVRAKQNIVVSGGTGSGKTTLLNVLSSFIPSAERLITLEDTAELQLNAKNLVRLETRLVRAAGSSVTIQDLLKNSLRMRPNRLIVGECRGGEAWDMLMAMNTGHEGSMTTIHANSAYDALRRLESMILRSTEIPLSMVQEDIANSINYIIQAERFGDGKRRVVQIMEVCGRNERGYLAQDIFKFSLTQGFHSTGTVPRYVQENADPRIKFPPNFFDPSFTVTL
jgi:pilus assembly protein CpaF